MIVTRTVGIMQPTYLPWLGYFEMIDASDVFIFLDDVQFNKKSWQQRNRIKGASGEITLTVPTLTKGKALQRIVEVRINNQENWAKKHLRSIEVTYAKSPYRETYLPRLREVYARPWDRLVDLNVTLIRLFMEFLGVNTPLVLSSELGIAASGNEKVAALCAAVDCRRLYDAAGAEKFIDPEIMSRAGIEIIYQRYDHPTYYQPHGPFRSHMSIVDLLLNEGPRSLNILRSGACHQPGLDAIAKIP